MTEDVYQNLIKFRKTSRFKVVSLNVLVKLIPRKSIKNLTAMFESFDLDNSGWLDCFELTRAFSSCDHHHTI